MSDPTGTAQLRRSFQAEGTRRLTRLRSFTHTMLVEHDLMATRNGPLAQLLPHPGNRLAAFTQWFEQTVNTQLLGGRWWERFLERAYQSGFVAGSELARVPPSPAPLPSVFRELASREFAGIAAALVQQVSRHAADAALGRRKPQPMYRQVLPVLRKVGDARVRAAANTLTVKVHNAGRLAQFRAAGIVRVGIDPERLQRRLPSRFLRRDHAVALHMHDRRTALAPEGSAEKEATAVEAEAEVVEAEGIESGWVNVLTAGDDDVCLECEDIADEGPYELDEAEILIPAHPNCRCAFVPARDELAAPAEPE
jgi:hypothetical protein